MAFTVSGSSQPDTINWDFGDGEYSSERNPTHIYKAPGTYPVALTVSNKHFTQTYYDTVHIYPRPYLGKDIVVCDNTAYTLTTNISNAYRWRWSTGDTTRSIYIAREGDYWGEIISRHCVLRDTLHVSFAISPQSANKTLAFCPDEGIPLKLDAGEGFIAYTWNTGETNPSIYILEPDTYTVTVTSMEGCQAKHTYLVTNSCPASLFIPNSFTPGYDNLNDTFKALGKYIDMFEMVIYNRWGTKVFETDNIELGWDGTFQGQPAPDGVYIFSAKAQGKESLFYETGTITLLRNTQ